mgnify:CR=1 FL=1
MDKIVLNITQSLQLAALFPCVLVILFLIFSYKNIIFNLLPIFYFTALGSSFIIPLITLFPEEMVGKRTIISLVFLEHLIPELSFLLIIQFITSKLPRPQYFLILTVPLIGESPFIYLYFNYNQICLNSGKCVSPEYLMTIYNVVSAALVFMLLTFIVSRKMPRFSSKDNNKKHKYWLILSIIIFNLILLGINLATATENIEKDNSIFIRTMIGVGFIYMAMSSIFRVFNESFNIKNINLFNKKEKVIAEKVENLMKEKNIYRKIGLSRKTLANDLGVNENTLSKVINWKFGKSFRELTNEYRIDEAKTLLINSKLPITTIAYDTGFKSITSFNRVFKEAVGKSASEFRMEKTNTKKKAS